MTNAATLALVAIVPLVVLMLTSFVKLSVVLSLLRNAIGAPDAPSGLVVTGLALVLTVFVMTPVAIDMIHEAVEGPAPAPAPAKGAPPKEAPEDHSLAGALKMIVPAEAQPQLAAAERAAKPLRAFLLNHAAPKDRETFSGLAKRMKRDVKGDELWVVAPAFLASQLREAFLIAVLVFIPFLVIDLVVGLALAALGLQTTSPQIVSLPLKLMLFVAVDGWRLLLDGLIRGYT
jgi:type III secretion protein R